MVRLLPAVLVSVVVAFARLAASAAEPAPGVSLLLTEGTAERWGKDIHFRCKVTLENALGRDLVVRSAFGSAFDGLQLVVTRSDGTIVAQQGYTYHQSPITPTGREFPLKPGKTAGSLVFPVSGLADARMYKVRLVGTLPGSGHDWILSTETLTVEVKDRPKEVAPDGFTHMNDRRERRSLEEVPPDIVARIRRDFGADEVGRVLPWLEDLRSDRLERCALFLAEGSIPRLKSAIKLGHEDYRDLIVAAEYDRDYKRLRDFNQPFSDE